MTNLNWQDAPEQGPAAQQHPAHHEHAAAPAPHHDSSHPHRSSEKPNLWFGISFLLIGVIIGFTSGRWAQGNIVRADTDPGIEIVPTAAQQPDPPTATSFVPVDREKDHILGNPDATIAMITYSDFECPYCKRAHPIFQQVMKSYDTKVMWVFRHYPLNFHANAQKEAEATECVNELGGNTAFWKYVDLIFARTTSNGTGISLEKLAPMAQEIGLNATKFQTCLDSGKYAERVKDDESGGSDSGINGTPATIVLNLKTQKNRLIPGAVPFEEFKTAIDSLLE